MNTKTKVTQKRLRNKHKKANKIKKKNGSAKERRRNSRRNRAAERHDEIAAEAEPRLPRPALPHPQHPLRHEDDPPQDPPLPRAVHAALEGARGGLLPGRAQEQVHTGGDHQEPGGLF